MIQYAFFHRPVQITRFSVGRDGISVIREIDECLSPHCAYIHIILYIRPRTHISNSNSRKAGKFDNIAREQCRLDVESRSPDKPLFENIDLWAFIRHVHAVNESEQSRK